MIIQQMIPIFIPYGGGGGDIRVLYAAFITLNFMLILLMLMGFLINIKSQRYYKSTYWERIKDSELIFISWTSLIIVNAVGGFFYLVGVVADHL